MRERLGDLYDPSGQESHCFTAQFQCFSKTEDGSNVALLLLIQRKGQFVADHVWIHRSKQLKQLCPERGDILAFEAVVGKYPRKGESFSRGEDAVYDFSLEKIREIRIVNKRGTISENG
jgi:hypothetical protein